MEDDEKLPFAVEAPTLRERTDHVPITQRPRVAYVLRIVKQAVEHAVQHKIYHVQLFVKYWYKDVERVFDGRRYIEKDVSHWVYAVNVGDVDFFEDDQRVEDSTPVEIEPHIIDAVVREFKHDPSVRVQKGYSCCWVLKVKIHWD